MPLVIVTGGTTGAADGTAVSQDGARTAPLVITALDTAVDVHLRGETGESDNSTFTLPAELEVSFDGGTTYYDSADNPIAASSLGPVNVPAKIRQSTAATASAGSFTTGGTWSAGTAPTLSGTLTATAGYQQVTLSGLTASDNVGIVKWQYRVDSGTWTDIATSATTTMPPTVVSPLTNGTEYSFTARALDAAANASDACAAVTATPLGFPDSLNDSSISSALYTRTNGGGTVVETTSLVTSSTTDTDLSIWGIDDAIANGKKVTVTGKCNSSSMNSSMPLLGAYQMDTHPKNESTANYAFATINPKMRLYVSIVYTSGEYRLYPVYRKTDGTQMNWAFSGPNAGTWTTLGGNVFYTVIGTSSCPNIRVEWTKTSATSHKIAVYNDDTSATLLAEQTMTDVKDDSNPFYLLCGDPLGDYYTTPTTYAYKYVNYASV